MLRRDVRLKYYFPTITLLIALFLGAVSTLGAETVNPDLNFYNGKVVSIVVPTKAGGGYDAYARMTARYLKKHLPGATVIVKNVPGAGHIIGANEVYLSKTDGLTFGIGNFKGLIFTQIAGLLEGIRFDLRKFSWLANVASEPQVLIVGKNTPYHSIKDFRQAAKPVRMGASGVGSSSYNYSLMAGHVLGVNFKLVPGFSGSEADMAMLRGELDGQIGAYDNLRPMIESEGSRILLYISKKKMPLFPDAPLIEEFATPEKRSLINLMLAMAELGRPVAAPPNMPAVRLKTLRDALEKAYKDPEMQAYSQKVRLPIHYISGEETRKLFVNALQQPPEVVKMVKDLAQSEK